MIEIIKARTNGSSIGLTIPTNIANMVGIKLGDYLGVDVIDNKIVISPGKFVVS